MRDRWLIFWEGAIVILGFEGALMLIWKQKLRNKAMTAVVQELLNTFDNLTYSERLDLLSEILRRTVYLDFESLSDEELTLNAEDIFLTLDEEELAYD